VYIEGRVVEDLDAEISPGVFILYLNANIGLGETLCPVVFSGMSLSSSGQIGPACTFWFEG
jgi:hypothetical protein